MTAPRIIVAGATTAITRRTTMRKAFLAPYHPLVNDIWLYALAYAQQATGVAVHHAIPVLNHHHLTVTPVSDNLPVFTQLFHHDVSCAINTLLARERYDSPREMFDGRVSHYMRLLDAPAQAGHLVYEYNNWVAAGLVAHARDRPGRRITFDHWLAGHIDVEKPGVFFGEGRPDVLRLKLTPPPLLYEAFGGDVQRLVYHMNRMADHGERALRRASKRQPAGARACQRIHPWSEPRSLRESGGQPVPTFRAGARGILGRRLEIAAARETRDFRREHRDARLLRRDGRQDALFPFGTYEMRALHGAITVCEPRGDAVVTRPGPLWEDCATLPTSPSGRDRSGHSVRKHEEVREASFRLVQDVTQALSDEADDLCDDAALSIEQQVVVTRSGSNGAGNGRDSGVQPSARDEVVVRHRFARDDARMQKAKRVVVLRDRRKGRPPGASTRSSSDPPA